jgi:hypothetical protein
MGKRTLIGAICDKNPGIRQVFGLIEHKPGLPGIKIQTKMLGRLTLMLGALGSESAGLYSSGDALV